MLSGRQYSDNVQILAKWKSLIFKTVDFTNDTCDVLNLVMTNLNKNNTRSFFAFYSSLSLHSKWSALVYSEMGLLSN